VSSFIAYHGDAGVFVKVVFIVFAAVIDKEILFFIDQLQNIAPACLKIRS